MRKFVVIWLGIMSCFAVQAQQVTYWTPAEQLYITAQELYEKEKYSAAQEKFKQVIDKIGPIRSVTKIDATYYHALCGLHLFNKDAEPLLVDFIFQYPENPKTKLAYFHLGRYQFRRKRYEHALEWFQQIDPYDLYNDEFNEYQFKIGYCYFDGGDLKKAATYFYDLKDRDTDYTILARYYYAHIAYMEGKYQSALEDFKKLESDPKFSKVIPYYIAQIYYQQKKYSDLIAYAKPLLETAKPKKAPEIARLIGDAYYSFGEYDKSIPFLTKYNESLMYAASREDLYQLGYAHYQGKQYDKAVKWLEMSAQGEDSIAQASHYHLADCFLRLNKKKSARNAFNAASNMNNDPSITEDALFNYAKISYELSYHPFNDAIKAFEKYINTYPSSSKINEAYKYLVAVYYSTKNYPAALASLDNIKKKGTKLQMAYQKIAHYRGIQQYNNGQYPEAIQSFEKSMKYNHDREVKALNVYWKAGAKFRMKDFPAAIGLYKQFLFEPDASGTGLIARTNYNLGYAYFHQKNYLKSNNWFRKFVRLVPSSVKKMKADGYNRIGDGYYMQKKFKQAIQYYDKAAFVGGYQADYALYQSALCNGVQGDLNEKATLLRTLVAGQEKSHLHDDAMFELGTTYLMQGKSAEALTQFNALTQKHPNTKYISKAQVKTGLVYYNEGNDAKALELFKSVVKAYPGTEEAHASLRKIKEIYIEKGSIGEYEHYVNSIGGNVGSIGQVKSSDYYEVAENSYMSGNCQKAVSDFERYLDKYPNGNYVLNAYYYRGSCFNKLGQIDRAVKDLKHVANNTKNKFTESALIQLARIYLGRELKQETLSAYQKLLAISDLPEYVLEAHTVSMRLNYDLAYYAKSVNAANEVLLKASDDPQLKAEAYLVMGKSALQKDENYNLAAGHFKKAAGFQNKFGAEAKYFMAYVHFLKGKYAQCEPAVFDMIKSFSAYDYWVGKSLLLLADNYLAQEDVFQAKITLQNVVDNSKHLPLVEIAKNKMSIIEQQQAARKEEFAPEDLEIEMNTDKELDELFNDENE